MGNYWTICPVVKKGVKGLLFIDDHDGVEGDSRAICLIHLVDVDGFTLRNLVLLVASADDCVHDNKHLLLYTRRNLRLRRCAL